MQTQGGGRVLVVPRPKHVPRPGSNLKVTRGGGVHKAGGAPKFQSPHQMGGAMGRRASNRNVKVTIGNKLRWAGARAGCRVNITGQQRAVARKVSIGT